MEFTQLVWILQKFSPPDAVFPGFSSLSPRTHHLITAPWPIDVSHPHPSGSNFCTSQNVISWGRKWSLCVRKAQCCRQCSRKMYLFFFIFLDCITCFFPPSSLFASRQDRSICIRPLKEFSDSCFQLFSLPGYDSNSPQAAEKGSKIHLSLSAQLLVTADGWCSNSQLLLMGFPEGCRLMILKSCFWHVYRVYLMSSLAGVGNTAMTKGRANTLLIRPIDFFML